MATAPAQVLMPLHMQWQAIARQDEEDNLGDKLADQLFDSLKDFIKDVSKLRTMTEAEKIEYIKGELKDRVKQKAYEQAYAFAENQAKEFATAQVKAAAWRAIEGRVRHEILINGALKEAAWSKLKAELDNSVEAQLKALTVFGTGAKIAGKVGWDEFDKIVSNQMGPGEVALKVLGGVYDALGESYIPFYGPFKKAVELEMALLEALDAYCKDETKQLWIGKVFGVDPLQGDFKLRLGKVLRSYTTKGQVQDRWRRNFTWEVHSFGLKVPQTDERIKELEQECVGEVMAMWTAAQADVAKAKAQAQQLSGDRILAEVKAKSAEEALKKALEGGMKSGKDTLATVDEFLTKLYPAAKAQEAQKKADKVKKDADKLNKGGLTFTFEDATKLVQVVKDYGQQVLAAIAAKKAVPNPIPVSQQLHTVTAQLHENNVKQNLPALEEIRRRDRAIYELVQQNKITEAEGQARRKTEVTEPNQAYVALQEAQFALYLAAMTKAETELQTQATEAALKSDASEFERLLQAVRLITEAAEKELALLEAKAPDIAAKLATPPNETTGKAPRDYIDNYEMYSEFVRGFKEAATAAKDLMKKADEVLAKFDRDLDLLYPQFEQAFGGSRYGNAPGYPEQVWGGGGSGAVGNPAYGYNFFMGFGVPDMPATIRIPRPVSAEIGKLKWMITGASYTSGKYEEIDTTNRYDDTLRTLEERADLSRPVIPFWDKSVQKLQIPTDDYHLLPPTVSDDKSYYRITADANWPYDLTQTLDSLKRGYEIRPAPHTHLPRQFRTVGENSQLRVQPIAVKEAKERMFAPYKAFISKYTAAIKELRPLAQKVPYSWIWDWQHHPRTYVGRLIQLEYLEARIAQLEKAYDDEEAECDRLYKAYLAYVEEQRRINDQNNQAAQAEMERRKAEAEAAIKKLYADFKSAYEQRDEALVASYLAKDWKAPDGTSISKLQDNLRRSFRVFDEVRFETEGLKLEFAGFDGTNFFYNVSYKAKIKGRIFQRNLNHEEVSDVVDRAAYGNGKALIRETTSGRLWTEGGTQQPARSRK